MRALCTPATKGCALTRRLTRSPRRGITADCSHMISSIRNLISLCFLNVIFAKEYLQISVSKLIGFGSVRERRTSARLRQGYAGACCTQSTVPPKLQRRREGPNRFEILRGSGPSTSLRINSASCWDTVPSALA